jgi:hypothetical protein
MTRFLHTEAGRLINADQVRSMDDRRDANGRWRAVALTDEGLLPLRRTTEEIERAFLPVVPAQPGYTVLCYYPPEKDMEAWVDRLPVVAWSIDEGCAYPVTLDERRSDFSSVLIPDGRVVVALDTIYADEQTWLTAQNAYHKPLAAE